MVEPPFSQVSSYQFNISHERPQYLVIIKVLSKYCRETLKLQITYKCSEIFAYYKKN